MRWDLRPSIPHYSVPYVQNFNLNIQRSLPSNMILQIGYVGSLGHRLASWYDGDSITPAGHAACMAGASVFGASLQQHNAGRFDSHLLPAIHRGPAAYPAGGDPHGLPNGTPWYKSVARQNTEGASNYNALQIQLIKARPTGCMRPLPIPTRTAWIMDRDMRALPEPA